MTNLREKIAAELKVRELLEGEDVPAPDRVEYGHTCIRLFWDEQQVALIVDIDEFAHPDADPQGLDAFPG